MVGEIGDDGVSEGDDGISVGEDEDRRGRVSLGLFLY